MIEKRKKRNHDKNKTNNVDHSNLIQTTSSTQLCNWRSDTKEEVYKVENDEIYKESPYL